jgi:acid phosphatase (class A)
MRYGAFVLASGLVWSVSAQAGLLAPEQFDAGRYLPPPPAADSATTKTELEELHAIGARSTPEERAVATHDAKDEKADMFNAAIGFDLSTMPETFKLLTMVGDEEEDDTKAAKAYFHRNRPYAVDSSLQTCTPVKPGKAANSYPSGHSTLAFSMGVVLASLMPEKAPAILARSSEYAEHRLVCGVHYRSDIVAGQQFGTIIALKLMENSTFQAQMAKAKAEIQAAHT